ncbi:uncharacterized protein L969DRAFT_85269 [Mixia osmundae IAM 14324]|uniref:uncharacterized protein n=1 Tax=Mixia osmundae (strain CBS 9802 / IAM 14324 / JCM 22182 / KY 12970) TaxID=764103 RepID=UPI0004A55516|nr:uncharacterized protein L969DRAFT_85269 [Mixia osmundae IAM 14324]KEI41490.1 hypothetical protein L969DRAFT_85269 [Mixia osmundae IAM 14324]
MCGHLPTACLRSASFDSTNLSVRTWQLLAPKAGTTSTQCPRITSLCELSNDTPKTAGGVHSPVLSGTSQAEALRPLRLPAILIGSHALGGISATLTAYESLKLRGYSVDAVLCLKEDRYANWDYLRQYFEKERQIPFACASLPPERAVNAQAERASMTAWYDSITAASERHDEISLGSLIASLRTRHAKRIDDLDTAGQRTLDTVWWPFVQHSHVKTPADVMVIDSAHKDSFSVLASESSDESDPMLEPVFDGSASWWTQAVGHSHPELALTAAHAAARYGHVLFPTATHKPALDLTRRLLDTAGKDWASRVFFSDDGSTGMEVAIKMALHSYASRSQLSIEKSKSLRILGLSGSYHGDTIGAMDASEPSIYNANVHWHSGRGFWFDPPSYLIENGKIVIKCSGSQWKHEASATFESLAKLFDLTHRLEHDELAVTYREHIARHLTELREQGSIQAGALLLEPILMGAGGMIFVDPLFQRVLIDTVREEDHGNLPVIFDEVFVGLHRLGQITTGNYLGVKPDVACYAKILTGGTVPMAVTLATSAIFESYLGEHKVDALLHGHSYTAHPIGCAVAVKALELVEQAVEEPHVDVARQRWGMTRPAMPFSLYDPDFVSEISSLPTVRGAMALGTVLAITLESASAGYASNAAQDVLKNLIYPPGEALAIHARPLGNVVYFMTSLNTQAPAIRTLENRIRDVLG